MRMIRRSKRNVALTIWLVALSAIGRQLVAQAPAYRLYGLDFSPYVDGQNPNFGTQVSVSQVQARLQLTAPYTNWIRSFSSTHGNENIPAVAKSMGLNVAAGAWIGRDSTANAAEISGLIASVQAGNVDLAIVGSEALLRNDVSESQLIAYINQVKNAIPATVPVATADTFDQLLAHPAVVAAGDVVLPNIYPYWMGVSLPNAICSLATSYDQVVAAAGAKPVIISETGWPSAGNQVGIAVPSPENASAFFLQFVSWARARDVPFFYFDALDETWKANYEGEQGAHWGLFDKNGTLKTGMQAVFDNQTVVVSCNGIPGGPGTPDLSFTYVPPYSATTPADILEGTALHVLQSDYRVVVYIFVPGFGWVVKPTSAAPLSTIQSDGTWSADVVTGGTDNLATQIAAFLIPLTYSPPLLFGVASLPVGLFNNSVAHLQVGRSPNSVTGRITDSSAHVVPGLSVNLSGTNSVSTTTAPDGRYSFFNISGVGPDVVTPSDPNYVFSPATRTVTPTSGIAVADFTASPTADVSIALDAATPVSANLHLDVSVVVANGGPIPASGIVAVIGMTGAVAGVTASTTTGTCTVGVNVTCNIGSLQRSAFATITIGLTPTSAGNVTFSASVSADQPDKNTGNNTQVVTITSVVPTCAPISVTNPGVTTGTTGSSFSQTFTQSGGVGATAFSIATGTLPGGLTLAATGVLSGTPTQSGSFGITVKATDVNGCNGTGGTYTLVISCPTITVTNPVTTSGATGTTFNQTFTRTGGTGTVTFTLGSGTLPNGLALADTGELSGTPTQAGSFPITVTATDSNGCTGTGATYALVICAPISVTNPGATTGTTGSSFSQTFTQSGGVGATAFSIATGTLPGGLTLATTGVLSGTPTQSGSFGITVKATDVNGCDGAGGTYTLVISCPTITVTNPVTASGTTGTTFNQTFTRTGGTGTVTFTLGSGTLPNGLSLADTGELSGTPTQAGSFPITVTATDSNGCTGTGATYALTIGSGYLSAPTGLTATATSTSQVSITWNAVVGANHYELFRNGAMIAIPSSTAAIDSGLTPGSAYIYTARTVDGLGMLSGFSTADVATTMLFTDDPIVPGTTTIKAAHIIEARTAVNAVRMAAGLSAFTFTNGTLTGASILAIHFQELRTALDQARTSAVLPALSYTNPLTTGTPVNAIDLTEIRNGTK
jgi:exo-beta-1,3-glucanase (GH17 family)